MHVSEDLPIEERISVLDTLAQKIANSGYRLSQSRNMILGGLISYERKLRMSRRTENEGGHKPLHVSGKDSLGARSRKKLLGKSTWFKSKEKNTDQENEDLSKMNVKTRQEMRKDERKEKKRKIREKKEMKDIAVIGSQMQFTGVMFVECTPFGELVRRL